MIRINQLTLPVDHGSGALKKKAARQLKIKEEAIASLHIVRRSIDARKKEQLLYSYIVDVSLKSEGREEALMKKAAGTNIHPVTESAYSYPEHGTKPLSAPPVIIGAGPAGLFAALALAETGYAPILLEQGASVEEREKQVKRFWEQGEGCLDPYSNVQFGEGGAGTFSDGKLNTLIKDTSGRNRHVLKTFVEAGAASEILYDSKPHIGTDVLRGVVRSIRERILQKGGQVRFHSRVTKLLTQDGSVVGVQLADGSRIACEALILAVGHSARELFFSLYEDGIRMEPKPFAVGLRIQHPQSQINRSQYGLSDPGRLGAAPYKLTATSKSGRGVYSFCMCPGGYVVNASSEKGRLAVNGMSNYDRAGDNANSALIVAVTPKDFPEPGPLGGIAFQRQLEERAFSLGNGKIPIQLYGDFAAGILSKDFGEVSPQFCGAYSFANLRELMPEALNQAFLEAMEQFDARIQGFGRPDAILAGIESRTSSPIRILRDEHAESNIRGLYPCGEGAGYAGGITSAAMDGLRVAEALITRYQPAK